jgi:hypothetical protein
MSNSNTTERQGTFSGDGKFIACVPWGDWVAVLVHRGEHHRLPYIRLRRWNKHRTKRRWYPTRRYFVVHADHADDLAEALHAAARGEPLSDEPAWLDEFAEDYAAYKERIAAEDATPAADDG